MVKKIRKLQIARFITQSIFLVMFPGLFALCFNQIRQMYSIIIKGNFNITQTAPHVIALLTIIPLTIIFGRFFCGWFCAFGTFNDFIYIISKGIFNKKFRINERVDSILKYLKYLILIFIIYVIWIKGSTLFNNLSPWNAFAQLPDFTLAFAFLVFIAIGAAFVERFFCRYLCPLGAIFSVISKIRILKVNKPTVQCGKCRMCTNNCSMGIKMYKVDKVTSGECINCFKCVEVCPRKNAQVSIIDKNINANVASAVVITTFAGLYFTTNLLGSSINKNNQVIVPINNITLPAPSINPTSDNNQSNAQQKKYKDGTYVGTGRGFKSGLTVSVTIKEDKIKNIEILSVNDTPGYREEPLNVVPKEIIQAQSTNVDGVSGATRTSDGVIMAVEDALSKASETK